MGTDEYIEAREEGWEQGHDDGYAEGFTEGVKSLAENPEAVFAHLLPYQWREFVTRINEEAARLGVGTP